MSATGEPRHVRTRSNASQQPYTPAYTTRPRRPSSPPLKKYSDSTSNDLNYAPPPSSTSSSFNTSHSHATPSSYTSNNSFPPPPPPIDIRDSPKRHRDRRGTDTLETRIDPRMTADFNSPRDAERWDRYQESRPGGERETKRESSDLDWERHRDSDRERDRDKYEKMERDRDRDRYEKVDRERERDRAANYEDWYREKPLTKDRERSSTRSTGGAYEYPRY